MSPTQGTPITNATSSSLNASMLSPILNLGERGKPQKEDILHRKKGRFMSLWELRLKTESAKITLVCNVSRRKSSVKEEEERKLNKGQRCHFHSHLTAKSPLASKLDSHFIENEGSLRDKQTSRVF
ncbi:Capsid protein VP1Polyomavirus protein [Dioscorea alata]|uniref:Capsid protein VP1Polyomavirus protein n=2 Tax=Dioscorea alata TaxID=55571 RepID=A0ACB7VHV0_DIOAL|nr:Capsid protein VP1Polyomavirus protein [Dioscorea alata]KAH7673588.1 Capsid protein VP1Polyomavirus protein [Dioscorea alata]